jgi:hypothetical protein
MNQQNLTQLESKLDNLKEFFYKLSELSRSIAESLEKQPVAPVEVRNEEQIMEIAKSILRENVNGLNIFQIVDEIKQRNPMLERGFIGASLHTLKDDAEINHDGRHYENRIFKIHR